MRLEELCAFEWRYDEDDRRVPDGGFVLIRPYGSEEGSGYGEGEGTVRGERIKGRVVWSNHPHRRSDGRMLPDAHGLVLTEDGARIVFELRGRTVFNDERSRGGQVLVGSFESDDDRYYVWLNDLMCIAEGVIHPEPNVIEIRVYAGINELIQ